MSPKRVLVVEDEIAVGLDIQLALSDAGFDVVGPITTVAEGLQAATENTFDAAVLDANLNGVNISAVADLLIERRVPFLVVSGYAREHLPLSLLHAPVLPKPFMAEKLLAAVRRLCGEPVSSSTSRP